MLKFIRGKGQQPTAERQRLQKELFAYRKVCIGINIVVAIVFLELNEMTLK